VDIALTGSNAAHASLLVADAPEAAQTDDMKKSTSTANNFPPMANGFLLSVMSDVWEVEFEILADGT
jgi:hypothetical protein